MSFLSSDSYIPGIFGLFGSLAMHQATGQNTPHDYAVLVTCKVSNDAILELCEKGFRVLRVTRQLPENFTSKNSGDRSAFRKRAKSPEKLLIFLASCLYKKIVYLDADMQVLSDPSKLMETTNHNFSAVPGQVGSRFNAGLFVYTSTFTTSAKVLNHALAVPSQCGASCEYFDHMSKNVGDQGILNVAFRNSWHALPITYNVKAVFFTTGMHWGRAYKPRRLRRPGVKIIHWIGDGKPWNAIAAYPCSTYTKTHSKYCACARSERYQVYKELRAAWWVGYKHYLTVQLNSSAKLEPKHLENQADKNLLDGATGHIHVRSHQTNMQKLCALKKHA
jgi:lipopolysaccharide biosynthesis glycosyltransferase